MRRSLMVLAALAGFLAVPAGGEALGGGALASALDALAPAVLRATSAPGPAPATAPAPDAAAVPAPALPDAPVPAAPAPPAPAPAAPVPVLPALLPALLPPAPVQPRPANDSLVSEAPRDALRRPDGPAPTSAGAAQPGAPAAGLGSQTVAADVGPQQGIGPSLQRGAADALAGPGSWYGSLPAEARSTTSALLGLLMTGLAVAGAYLTGFRHIGRENLLEHNTRAELLDLVRACPGIHLREVARRLGMTTTNAGYHLRVLERHGVVRSERQNGKRVYMPAGGRDANRRNLALALLRRESRAQVALALLAQPGINQLRLARATGQHQGAVSWHVRRLVEAGVASEERTARECRYALTPLGVELVREGLARPSRRPAPAAPASAVPHLVTAAEPAA